jgi:hypothetical protein
MRRGLQRRELRRAVDRELPPLLDLAGSGKAGREPLAVLLEPLVGVAASRPQA